MQKLRDGLVSRALVQPSLRLWRDEACMGYLQVEVSGAIVDQCLYQTAISQRAKSFRDAGSPITGAGSWYGE